MDDLLEPEKGEESVSLGGLREPEKGDESVSLDELREPGKGEESFSPDGSDGLGEPGKGDESRGAGALDRVVFDQPILDRKGTPAGTAAEVASPPRRPLPGDI